MHSGKFQPSDMRILHTQKWTGLKKLLIQLRACPVNIKDLSSIPRTHRTKSWVRQCAFVILGWGRWRQEDPWVYCQDTKPTQSRDLSPASQWIAPEEQQARWTFGPHMNTHTYACVPAHTQTCPPHRERKREKTLKDTAHFLLQAISSVQLAGIADVLDRLPLS